MRGVRRLQRNNIRVLTITSALMLLGAGVNALYHAYVSASGGEAGVSLAREPLVHDLIYYALLPPIIFEAGCLQRELNAQPVAPARPALLTRRLYEFASRCRYTMEKRKFFANFGAIMLYAVGGTLIAVVSGAGILFAMTSAGWIDTQFTPNQLLLFASLISSTDPVATLSVLKAFRTKPPLYDLIFGESALNDALSIVLFNLFKVACRADDEDDMRSSFADEFFRLLAQLAMLIPASIAIGIAFGCISGCAATTEPARH